MGSRAARRLRRQKREESIGAGLGSVAVSDGSQSMSDPLRTVLVRRPDASFGGAERRRQFCQTLNTKRAVPTDATLYEWNHPKQLITIRIEEARKDPKALEREIFSEEFLLKRPLLQALTHGGPQAPVLLIDEIDRADEEFEGLLLEFLSDFQITIPEMGTIRAKRVPHVVITSNRTRELSDALKRRCLYLYIGYPSREKEVAILRAKVPGLGEQFAEEIAGFVQRVRAEDDFVKRPGISETLEWASALMALGTTKLDRDIVEQTLGLVVKDAQDLQTMQAGRLDALMGSP